MDRRLVPQKAGDSWPNRARIQDNQILTSAYDEILSQTFSYNCLMISKRPVREAVKKSIWLKFRVN